MKKNHHEECGCDEYNQLSRRQFVAGAASVGAVLASPIFPEWLPQVVLAESADTSKDVIVSIFLRGGADGLTLCVPFSDPGYYTARSTIAVPRPDSSAANRGVALNDNFAFPRA